MKKVYGFILHFGHVESSYCSSIILHHMEEGFDDLKSGLASLSNFFLNDFLAGYASNFDFWERYEKPKKEKDRRPRPFEPELDHFVQFLRELPTNRASEEPVFDSEHTEEWWPWDPIHEQIPYFQSYWEYTGELWLEGILPRYADVEAMEKEYPQFGDFFTELRATRSKPVLESVDSAYYDEPENIFTQVLRQPFYAMPS